MRNSLSSKMVFFTSGKVHPGHQGFLYFPLINLGDEPVLLKYGEPLVALELIEIDPPAIMVGPNYEDIPEGLIPKFHPRPAFTTLFERVDQMADKFRDFELISKVNGVLVGSIILAVLAGIVAGLTVQFVQQLKQASFPSVASLPLPQVVIFAVGTITIGIIALIIVFLALRFLGRILRSLKA